MLSILSKLEIARLVMVWYLVQASQALQAVQAVQPMLHGESPPMMTPLQQVRLYKDMHYEILIFIKILSFLPPLQHTILGPHPPVFNGPGPDCCSCPALPYSARLCSTG